MLKGRWIIGFWLLSTFVVAQDYRAEVFGGYSYLNADFNQLVSRQSFHGWEAGVSANFNKWVAAEWDGAGYYKRPSGGSATDYSFAAGPRFNFQPGFVHALFGFSHLILHATGVGTASQDSLAGVVGGGVEWPSHSRIAVRGSGDYAFTRHNVVTPGFPFTQHNFRASAGVVFRFGSMGNASAIPRSPATKSTMTATAPTSSMPIPQLGVRAMPREDGAQIVEVIPGSAAELAGLRVEDVITAVDDKPIKSPMELAAQLSNRAAGSNVKLRYRIRGYWNSETTIIVGQK